MHIFLAIKNSLHTKANFWFRHFGMTSHLRHVFFKLDSAFGKSSAGIFISRAHPTKHFLLVFLFIIIFFFHFYWAIDNAIICLYCFWFNYWFSLIWLEPWNFYLQCMIAFEVNWLPLTNSSFIDNALNVLHLWESSYKMHSISRQQPAAINEQSNNNRIRFSCHAFAISMQTWALSSLACLDFCQNQLLWWIVDVVIFVKKWINSNR